MFGFAKPPRQDAVVAPLARPDFRAHLIRALLDWHEEQGLTPMLLVEVDEATVCPRELVQDGRIAFLVSSEAVNDLSVDPDRISFEARFGERVREVSVPLGRVLALFPREDPALASYFRVSATPARETKDQEPVFTKL